MLVWEAWALGVGRAAQGRSATAVPGVWEALALVGAVVVVGTGVGTLVWRWAALVRAVALALVVWVVRLVVRALGLGWEESALVVLVAVVGPFWGWPVLVRAVALDLLVWVAQPVARASGLALAVLAEPVVLAAARVLAVGSSWGWPALVPAVARASGLGVKALALGAARVLALAVVPGRRAPALVERPVAVVPVRRA